MSSGAVNGTTLLFSSSSMAASIRAARDRAEVTRGFFTGGGALTTCAAFGLAFLALVWVWDLIVMILLRISYLIKEINSLHKILYRKPIRLALTSPKRKSGPARPKN